MSRSAFNIKSKEEASQLHQKVITEFVDEAVKQLEAGGYFLYATEISSERNGWQTSISYCICYIGGKHERFEQSAVIGAI